MMTSVSGERVSTEVRVQVALEFYPPAPDHPSATNVASTVHDNRLAGHVVGLQQINHGTRNIVRRAQALERRRLAQALADVLLPSLGQQDHAWCDCVDAYRRRQRLGEGSCHLN